MSMRSIVMRGWLGWGNNRGPFDTYGPGGRWYRDGPDKSGQGDVLADALQREGGEEGMHLVVVAVDRFFDLDKLAELEDYIAGQVSSDQPIREVAS